MAVIGSDEWLDEVCRAVNASTTFRERARGWHQPVGLGFEDHGKAWWAMLHLDDGMCTGAEAVDHDTFAAAELRISGSVDRWLRLLTGGIDPLRCLMLQRLELVGDPLRTLKFLPAAKALLAAAVSVPVQTPANA